MTQPFNKEHAKNIFYGGTVFFLLLLIDLVFNISESPPIRDWKEMLDLDTEQGQKIAIGKAIWQQHNCVGCHSIIGEGAYFAPELVNIYQRYDYNEENIKLYLTSRPTHGIFSRRSMPQFNFTESELEAIVEFFKYTSKIDTLDWPPNKEG